MILFSATKKHRIHVLFMIVENLVPKLELIFATNGVHIWFCQHGGPIDHPCWQSAEIERVWYGQYLDQIWCVWKDLNQTTFLMPQEPRLSTMQVRWLSLIQRDDAQVYVILLMPPSKKLVGISLTTISGAFSWIKNYGFLSKFHWSVFLKVQLTITQYR